MAKMYEWDNNPFQDFLLRSILYGIDISDKEYEVNIYVGMTTFLEYFIDNEKELSYLDFKIVNKDNYFKVIPNNSISAFWLSGVFPKDIKKVLDTNELVFDEHKFKYDARRKKLKYIKMKK